jgi:hypothetical protein
MSVCAVYLEQLDLSSLSEVPRRVVPRVLDVFVS